MIGGFHPWFCEELNRRIAQRRAERAMSLASGAAGDFADYRYGVGYLDGLQAALDVADEIRKEQEAA